MRGREGWSDKPTGIFLVALRGWRMRICVTTVGIEETDATEQLRDILPLFSRPFDSRFHIKPDTLLCEVR